jgi:chromosome segregation ATPase
LTTDAENVRKEAADMKARLAKLSELEKSNAILFKDKSNLLEQVGKLSIELKEVKDSCVKINKELATLTDKLGKVQKENDGLKVENGDLVLKQAELKAWPDEAAQIAQTASSLKSENAQLKAIVTERKAHQAASAVGETSATGEDKETLQEKIRTLEEQDVKLKAALEEWTALAKVCALSDRTNEA